MSQDLGDSTLGAVSKAFREHTGLDQKLEDADGNPELPETELEPTGDEHKTEDTKDDGDKKPAAKKSPAKNKEKK